ncbi:MAG: hypothetical protein HY746_04435 [Elusimicrobia bacterium]|nr:hypothetical protein [Elusimicrobiota bacterium]
MAKWRKGQTVVEYILITLAMVIIFVFMHRYAQIWLTTYFKAGGKFVIRMYTRNCGFCSRAKAG